MNRRSLEWSPVLSQTGVCGLIAAAFFLWIMFPLPACWQVAMWLRDPFNTESDATAKTGKSTRLTHSHDHCWMWIYNPTFNKSSQRLVILNINIWKLELVRKWMITHHAILTFLPLQIITSTLGRSWLQSSLHTPKPLLFVNLKDAAVKH